MSKKDYFEAHLKDLDALQIELKGKIEYHAREFNISYAEILGILECIKYEYLEAHIGEAEDDDGK